MEHTYVWYKVLTTEFSLLYMIHQQTRRWSMSKGSNRAKIHMYQQKDFWKIFAQHTLRFLVQQFLVRVWFCFLGLRRQSSLSWPFQGVSGCWTYCWTDGVMELPLLTNVENNVNPKVFITLANYLCYNLGTTYFHKHAHYHNYAHLDIKPGPSAKADCKTTSNNNTSRPITWSYL